MNVRLFKPSVGKEELAKIEEAFNRSWIGLGPNVKEFENKWKEFVGCKEAIGLNSATAALHLAITSCDFETGKKVLVPSMTFVATATAILHNGLIPVFVDSDPVTLGMDLEDLDRKYTKDCVAVMPVHYAGHPVPMDQLMEWSKERNLRVIEDCAHTTGAKYQGKSLGTWGDLGCYSFEEKKLMTTGDGGMLVSNDSELIKDVKALRWVGIDKDNWKSAQAYTSANKNAMHWFYEINVLGFKYNMNDLAASIGLVQLEKLPAMNQRRSEIIQYYMNGLQSVDQVKPLLPYEPAKYCYQMFGIRTDDKDDLIIHLKSRQIATGCHYTPLSSQPLFKKWKGTCPYVEKEVDRCITLPLHADLTNEEIEYVIDGIQSFYA